MFRKNKKIREKLQEMIDRHDVFYSSNVVGVDKSDISKMYRICLDDLITIKQLLS